MPRVRLTTLSVLKLSLSLAGLPQWLSGKDSPAIQETQEMVVRSLGWEDPLEEEMATCSSLLPGKPHVQRSPVGYSPWGCKRVGATEYTLIHTLNLASPMEGFLSGPLGLLLCRPPRVGCLGAQSLNRLHVPRPLSLDDLVSSHGF